MPATRSSTPARSSAAAKRSSSTSGNRSKASPPTSRASPLEEVRSIDVGLRGAAEQLAEQGAEHARTAGFDATSRAANSIQTVADTIVRALTSSTQA